MALEEKYKKAYDLWRSKPGPDSNSALLQTVAPILSTAVKTYGGANPSPMIKSKARQMALKAMPRYDPEKAALSTFLMQQLQGLQRARFAEQEAISIPEQVRLDQSWLSQKENELSDSLGRAPSALELADATGLSPHRIGHIQKARSGLAEGSLLGYDDASEQAFAPEAHLPGDDDSKAWTEFVYHGLDPTDQVILEHSVGLFNRPRLSNQAIAKKLNISPPAVSQRRNRIQSKLDQRGEFEVL